MIQRSSAFVVKYRKPNVRITFIRRCNGNQQVNTAVLDN